MFCLYLSRSGRTTLDSAAQGLSLDKEFLAKIANRLKDSGVVISTRGPGGGYELSANVRVVDVLNAVDPVSVLSREDMFTLAKGSPEARALVFYSKNLVWQMSPMLQLSIKDVMADLVQDEMSHLNRLDVNGLEQ
jgi:DNA-binding IscR family transcriptional regulator